MFQEKAREAMIAYILQADWHDPQCAFWPDDECGVKLSHERCVALGFHTRDFAAVLAEHRQQSVVVYDRRPHYLFWSEFTGEVQNAEPDEVDLSVYAGSIEVVTQGDDECKSTPPQVDQAEVFNRMLITLRNTLPETAFRRTLITLRDALTETIEGVKPC